ncbi:MAG: hypothetical protein K0Q55_2173 [Verrucomicrobia bacterium]|jgi:hypothetical protein|nr:hypothetical protein [Verrucomicrobiota bacterium]
MKTAVLWLVALLCVGVAGYAVYSYAVLAPGTTVAPAMKATYEAHKIRILVHVFFAAIALLVGPFQFFPAVRKRRVIHRTLGYIYFGSVLVGGVAGLGMAVIAYGGLVSKVGFGALAVLWLFTAAKALFAIRSGSYDAHEVWAIRCFALTFAAVTLRIYLGVFFGLGVPFDAFYPALGWLCWVPNLLFAEWIILPRIRKPKKALEPTPETGAAHL